MGITQVIFGIVLVLMLLFLGGYYAWRQLRNLRALRILEQVSPLDRGDAYRQAWRRLVCSGFMLLFAAFLVGSFILDGRAQELADFAKVATDRGEEPAFDEDQLAFRRFWGIYWIVGLLVFFAIVVLAALDVWAIRRTGRRLHKQLQDERRAMIAEQLARLRAQHNGRELL